MTDNWVADIHAMHQRFGHSAAFPRITADPKLSKAFLDFRVAFLAEELKELQDRIDDPEEVVDACIDLCVVAIGTLDAFEVDAQRAWDVVLEANMAKEAGVNPNRPNEFGLPDLTKPVGWTAPSHQDNHGSIPVKH